jgi:serine/threonine protein kinase
MFVEFCNGKDLRNLLEIKGNKLDEKLVRKITKQIVDGLCHLNKQGTVHRDLKLDNIMINFPEYDKAGLVPESYIENFDHEKEEIEVIIGDLGFAKSLGSAGLATSY